MLRVYREDDADLKAIEQERLAVIGYGIQGRAQALNLRDSGLDVCVGNRDDAYAAQARHDGFEVLDIGALVVAHGFSLRYDLIDVPAGVDALLLAPRLPGRYVRDRFVAGSGVPAYIDVARDTTGRAWPRLLALAKSIGATRAGAIALTVAAETELDLFSEQFTFPLIFRALEIAFDELVAAGCPPEAAVMDLHGSGELGQILLHAAEVGLYSMLQSDGSPVGRYGVLSHRESVLDERALRGEARLNSHDQMPAAARPHIAIRGFFPTDRRTCTSPCRSARWLWPASTVARRRRSCLGSRRRSSSNHAGGAVPRTARGGAQLVEELKRLVSAR